MTNPERPHGYIKYAMDKCRCTVCRKETLDYERWRRAERKAGRSRLVDAEPARQHVLALAKQGMGHRRVARAAGVPEFTMKYLINGDPSRGFQPAKRVSVMTAKKILAVEFDLALLSDRSLIDGTGVRRRLQSLMAAGWTLRIIANRLDMVPGNLRKLFSQDRVRVETHRLVVALHSELWDKQPPQETARERVNVRWAKERAAERGYVPAAAWDDIDDPADVPQVDGGVADVVDEVAIRRVLAGGDPSILSLAEKYAAARILVNVRGGSLAQAQERLRMAHRTVKKAVAA